MRPRRGSGFEPRVALTAADLTTKAAMVDAAHAVDLRGHGEGRRVAPVARDLLDAVRLELELTGG